MASTIKKTSKQTSQSTQPRMSMWAIHYQVGFHPHTLITMARTAKGARINLENDWAMMPLAQEEDQEKWAYPRIPLANDDNDTIYDIQGPYTTGVEDLIKGDERITTEKKWTDAAREDKGMTGKETSSLPYEDQPALWCFCWDEVEGKRVQKYFFTISGVIRHAWVDRIQQRSLHISALDG